MSTLLESWTGRLIATFSIVVSILGQGDPAAAESQQYRALLTRYFLQNHQAIPLFNSGNVKSGDVLKLPDEAKYVSRTLCYDTGEVAYRRLRSEFIKTSFDLAGEVGGSVPVQKIAAIKAELGGKIQTEASIELDPLSEEQPLKGYIVLESPKPVKECEVIRNILKGNDKEHILVTRVFFGRQSAAASFDVSANANVSAEIKEKRIRAILGGTPDVHVKIDGARGDLQISRTPDEQSLAVQSAFINPKELARIYLGYQSSSSYQLELMVEEYITGTEPDALKKLQVGISTALKELNLFFRSTAALYSAIFGGDNAVPLERATSDIPPEQWRAFAVVAAAHEIVAEPPLPR